MKITRVFALFGVALAGMALSRMANAAALSSSSFDTNNDGWTLTDDAIGSNANYQGGAGNPGGCVGGVDSSTGGTWYYCAPAKFLGKMGAAYGGTLQFDIKQALPSDGNPVKFFADADVKILGSNGTTYVADLTPNPQVSNWSHFSLTLTEQNFRVSTLTGRPATQAEIKAALGALKGLWIRGEYLEYKDASSLDNVLLSSPASAATAKESGTQPLTEETPGAAPENGPRRGPRGRR